MTIDEKAKRQQKKWDKKNCKKKKRFPSAMAALVSVGLNVPMSAYQCPVCGSYHLTTKQI